MGEVTLNPYAYLVDTQGTALDDGLIYVGVANENPVTNPIDLFYDADLTVAAPNPIPTINGFAANTGAPIRVYTSELAYSIKATDKNGVQIFYEPRIQNTDMYRLDALGALSRTVNSKLSDFINVADFGAVPDGETDCTDSIQAAIDYANLSGGGAVYLNSGVYMISGLTMRSRVSLIGKGQDLTELRMIVGSNQDAIVGVNIESVTLKDLRINGQYLLGEYNEPDVDVGNSMGGGINWSAAAFVLDDVIITNIAGIGLLSEPPTVEQSQYTLQLTIIDCIVGICGKEGIIIRGGFGVGNGDWLMRRAWVGLCGLLPRPLAHTQIAMSDYYPDDPCDGIVIHRANIECGDIHTYANWSGCGFRTRDICRLTKGGRIISESNRSQVQIDDGAYGSAFFDVRFLGTLHPNWSATIPTYTQPMAEFDGVTINASKRFRCEVTVRNIKQLSPRVVGVTGVHVTSSACVNMLYSNSTGRVGDPEEGEFFTGDALLYTGAGASIEADVEDCNGHAIHVKGESGNINFAVKTNKSGGSALHRDSNDNTKFANNIRGTVHRSALAFLSTGTPAIEQISLTINAVGMEETVFSGDPPSLSRDALWHINAVISEDGLKTLSTCKTHSFDLDSSSTAPRYTTFEHGYLYQPSMRMVQISLDDRAALSSARLGYIAVNEITDTEITIVYKFDISDSTPAANLRANVLIMQGGGGNTTGAVTVITPNPNPEDEDAEIDYLAIFNAALES